MSELLRELEEDFRNERLQRLWNSFGKLIVHVSLGIVLATAGMVGWQNYRRVEAQKQTAALLKGMERMGVEDYQGAIETFDGIRQNPYRALAMLHKAEALAALGKNEQAQETYLALAAEPAKGDARAFIDLAGVMAASAAAVAGQIFYPSRAEQQAWALLADGKREEAKQEFLRLSQDQSAPPSLQARAAAVAKSLE